MSQFIYLLNAFEAASQHDTPAEVGYAAKRKALLEYVEKLESARPEVVQNGWNDAIAAASKMLRSSADNCQPGSPAETHNWPFVLETMARKVEGLKQTIPSPLAEKRGG